MASFLVDLRRAVRSLAKAPRFTAIVVLTLAIALGATTAVFSIVNGVLLNSLGFADPDKLVYIQSTSPTGAPMPASPQDLADYAAQTHSFTAVAAVDAGRNMNFARDAGPASRISAARVGADFFSILGVHAAHGRMFAHGEDSRSAPRVVVLSDAMWKRELGADPRVVGKHLTLDGDSYEVVGIAPPGFDFPTDPDVWYPAVWRDWEIGDASRGYHSVAAIGRLTPGATVESASRDLQSVAAHIAHDHPEQDAKIGALATSLRTHVVGDLERPLWMMFGAVFFVLLIACANVGNLLLVRASARDAEMAIRAALGASRRRLVQQLFAESLALTATGALFGILLASWLIDFVVAFGPRGIPQLRNVGVDARVLMFDACVMVAVALGFGLLPALRVVGRDLVAAIRTGGRGLTSSRGSLRSTIVVAELALATVLVVGAGLLIKSFDRLMSVSPGFRSDRLVVFDVALAGKRYEYDAPTIAFAHDVLRRLAAIPGTRSAAVSANRPIDPNPAFDGSTSFTIDGAPRPTKGNEPESALLPVSPEFFNAMGMSVVRGRAFTADDDRDDAPPAVIVNQALVARYFPGEDPIGKRVTFGLTHTRSADPSDSVHLRGEIVGVVHNVQQSSLTAKPEPSTYFPYHMLPFGAAFVVRTDANSVIVEREIRTLLAAVDRTVPIYELETMSDAIAGSVAQPRFYTELLGAFAAVALLLGILGIYGVISDSVAQRSREFGIRLALGASPRDVVAMVARRGMLLAATGIVLGIVGALFLTRAMQSLLFQVAPLDPLAFAAAALVLLAAALGGTWVPSRRAANADPISAMRSE